MKKIVKLLSLLLVLVLAVCVFVACNDTPDTPDTPDNPDTPNDGGDDKKDPPDEEVDKSKKFTATFKFIAPDGTELDTEVERRNIAYGGLARVPNGYENNVSKFADYVVIGWDTDDDGQPDKGYETVKKDMVIKAVLREKQMFTVKFYESADKYVEVSVKEGDAVDMSKVSFTPQVGKMFKNWTNADSEDQSTLDSIRGNASFVATFATIDSIIPLVDKNTIVVDGKKDDAYLSGAYLPVNEERHADRKESTYTAADAQAARPKNRNDPSPHVPDVATSWITADAWLVWDGDYIYMMLEISDKTLTARSPKYVQMNVNAWLNDNVEAYFNFEQASTSEVNKKKLGLDAMSQRLFANSIAVYGNNSTHYEEMDGAARSALGYYENGVKKNADPSDGLTYDKATLESTDNVGVQYAATLNAAKNYSHRIELKFAAKTEGVPDKENYDVDDNGRLAAGSVIPDGDLAGETVPELTNVNDPENVKMGYYRFTEGEKLVAGNFVRFALQINDLMVSMEDMNNPDSGFYEDVAKFQPGDQKLYTTTGQKIYPPFVPVGNTQYDLPYYVAYSLGGEGDAAKWEVYEMKGSDLNPEFKDANGNTIVQGSQTVTVEIAK